MADLKKISATEARANWSEVLNRVGYGKDTFIITRRGLRDVAVVSMEILRAIEKAEQS